VLLPYGLESSNRPVLGQIRIQTLQLVKKSNLNTLALWNMNYAFE
jgi:hypothetical protein